MSETLWWTKTKAFQASEEIRWLVVSRTRHQSLGLLLLGIFSNTRKSQKKFKILRVLVRRVLVRRPSCWCHYDRSYCRYGEDSQNSTLNLLLIKKILGNKGILLSSYYLTLLTLQSLTVYSPQRSYIIPRWVRSFF